MRAHFGLPSVEAEDKEGKPPISVKFEIPYFTTSGIQVHPALSRAGFCQDVLTACVRRLRLCACKISLRTGLSVGQTASPNTRCCLVAQV